MDYNRVDHEDCLSIKTLKDKAPSRGSMLLPRIIHCSLFIIIFICIVILGFVITLTCLSNNAVNSDHDNNKNIAGTDTNNHEETHADTKDKLMIQDQHSNMSSLHKVERDNSFILITERTL